MTAINTLIPAPEDFATQRVGSDEYPIPPYARFLEGVRICLDPGHGGDAHKRGYKRGPTGVREAEMNLRVAQYLREFLEAAGAEVRLTREGDVDISLADRAAIANEWGADLFISLHHNAIGNKPHVNYTTVWYHNDVNYRPSNLDLARYLCYGLYDSIALAQVTDVPLKSDQLMYESGFAVLRHADVTAALTESSFFTNPEEEQRLRNPDYSLLEAYGLFVGLAKYAAAGLPKAYVIEPEDAVVAPRSVIPRSALDPYVIPRSASDEESGSGIGQTISSGQSPAGPPGLVFELDDGLRARKAWGHDRQMILTDTVAARVDGQPVSHGFSDDGERYLLTVPLPDDLPSGEHHVEVHFENMNKNSVLNPHFTIEAR
jgi:N-acetylmuramoyl-L-alanine amidase